MTTKSDIKTVPIDQIVNPWGNDEKIKREVENAARRAEEGVAFPCKKCRVSYNPPPGTSIFYDLCDTCFKAFDTQKMEGRMATLHNKDNIIHHFEDVDEWIAQG